MNRRQKIIVSVTGIFIVLLALIGLTYAYFVTKVTGNTNDKSITVTTANLKLVYGGDDGNVIGGNQLFPSNTEHTKTFTVYNEGDVDTDYGVYLIDVVNTFERKDDIKYTMTCTTDGTLPCGAVNSETTFPSGISQLSTATIESKKTHTYTFKFTYKDTGTDQSVDMNKELEAKIQIFGENGKGLIIPHEVDSLAYNIINNASNEKNGTSLILDGSVESRVANESSGYELRTNLNKHNPTKYLYQNASDATWYYIAYACDYTINEEGYFTLGTEECPVTTTTTTYTNSEEMINNLKGKFYLYNPMSSTVITTNQYSLYKFSDNVEDFEEKKFKYAKVDKYISTEKVLATTEDDYGTSYYYRGGVENNYVNFAGMCWRIIRIAGDGSTKLILEDQDELCGSQMDGKWQLKVTDYSYGGYFSYTKNNNEKYIFNYLNKDGTAYKYEQSMASTLKSFQMNKLNNYLDKLKSGDWCLSDKAYATKNANINAEVPLTEEEKLNIQSSAGTYYYDTYVRLYRDGQKQPTLRCNGTIMDKFNDDTFMYVGAITADELGYAGVSKNSGNFTPYYLYNIENVSGSYFTISLAYFDRENDLVFLGDTGTSFLRTDITNTSNIRPVINLRPNSIIASGDGTIDKPYVVS